MKADKSKFQQLHHIETKLFLLLITKQYMYINWHWLKFIPQTNILSA